MDPKGHGTENKTACPTGKPNDRRCPGCKRGCAGFSEKLKKRAPGLSKARRAPHPVSAGWKADSLVVHVPRTFYLALETERSRGTISVSQVCSRSSVSLVYIRGIFLAERKVRVRENKEGCVFLSRKSILRQSTLRGRSSSVFLSPFPGPSTVALCSHLRKHVSGPPACVKVYS